MQEVDRKVREHYGLIQGEVPADAEESVEDEAAGREQRLRKGLRMVEGNRAAEPDVTEENDASDI